MDAQQSVLGICVHAQGYAPSLSMWVHTLLVHVRTHVAHTCGYMHSLYMGVHTQLVHVGTQTARIWVHTQLVHGDTPTAGTRG